MDLSKVLSISKYQSHDDSSIGPIATFMWSKRLSSPLPDALPTFYVSVMFRGKAQFKAYNYFIYL